MQNRKFMLNQLDRLFAEWPAVGMSTGRPQVGWIRTIRKALGMTAAQLGRRLGLKRNRIVQLESAEQHGAVSLHTLKSVAEAMDCQLIYALVPKSSLKKIREARAKHVASQIMGRVAHSMSLEAQSVSKDQQNEQMEELIKSLLEGSPKKLWEE